MKRLVIFIKKIIEKFTQENSEIEEKLVQDNFFANGSTPYKAGQTAVSVFGWLVLLFPLLIMINSIFPEPLFSFIYHWSGKQGRLFLEYVSMVAFAAIVIFIPVSIFLVKINNKVETEELAKRKFYDETRTEARLALMDEIYTERFGGKQFRENTDYYIVQPEQNFSKKYIKARYKDNEKELNARKD